MKYRDSSGNKHLLL